MNNFKVSIEKFCQKDYLTNKIFFTFEHLKTIYQSSLWRAHRVPICPTRTPQGVYANRYF